MRHGVALTQHVAEEGRHPKGVERAGERLYAPYVAVCQAFQVALVSRRDHFLAQFLDSGFQGDVTPCSVFRLFHLDLGCGQGGQFTVLTTRPVEAANGL